MLATVRCATILGIDGIPIRVEVDISGGMPGFATVGLPESSVREARVRVQAALTNCDYCFPAGRITVNLAPANLRKDGTGFDLPIALGILAASGVIPKEKLESVFALGELSLSGDIKPVRGVIAAAEAAQKRKSKLVLVAPENGAEAALIEGLNVKCVKNFKDAADYLITGDESKVTTAEKAPVDASQDEDCDLADVRGQHHARRALEVAAAGGHNILFVGGPGSGKTMMAKRLPSILPPLTHKEAMEVTRIHSVAGLNVGGGLISKRPFRAPHHSTTPAGLAGGGAGIPRPGELSLATNGVLFLDELPEFPRPALEIMRQPLESGEIILCRAQATLRYPAKLMLIAAMNPCPCGNYGTPKRTCRCSFNDVARYRARLSGPLLDRIDLHIEVPPVDIVSLQSSVQSESSSEVLGRVIAARQLQYDRLPPGITNATMGRAKLVETATPTAAGSNLLASAMDRLSMSARSYDRILRVARTIADLEGAKTVDVPHIAEAIQYRGERKMLMAA